MLQSDRIAQSSGSQSDEKGLFAGKVGFVIAHGYRIEKELEYTRKTAVVLRNDKDKFLHRGNIDVLQLRHRIVLPCLRIHLTVEQRPRKPPQVQYLTFLSLLLEALFYGIANGTALAVNAVSPYYYGDHMV